MNARNLDFKETSKISRLSTIESLKRAVALKINLSMPESIDFYQMQLIEAVQYHAFLLANPDKRPHRLMKNICQVK